VKRFVVARASELNPGERLIVECESRSLGVFNVEGKLFALHNRCPHQGAPLCLGIVTGTTLPVDGFEYVYGHEQRILRCPWHGWEFDIETGRTLADPRVRARIYRVCVEDGDIVAYI
jgi:nitrite reductase (NADH) small subunit